MPMRFGSMFHSLAWARSEFDRALRVVQGIGRGAVGLDAVALDEDRDPEVMEVGNQGGAFIADVEGGVAPARGEDNADADGLFRRGKVNLDRGIMDVGDGVDGAAAVERLGLIVTGGGAELGEPSGQSLTTVAPAMRGFGSRSLSACVAGGAGCAGAKLDPIAPVISKRAAPKTKRRELPCAWLSLLMGSPGLRVVIARKGVGLRPDG